MVLGLRKRKPITVEFVELPIGTVISEVDSTERLMELNKQPDQIFIETPGEIYLVSKDGNIAFRFVKPEAKPRIIQAEKLELNPDSFSVKAELTQPVLFEFAKRQSLFLFETNDGWFIPSDSVVFYANKENGKV